MFSCCSRCFFSFAELINKCAEGKYEIELIEGKKEKASCSVASTGMT